MTNPLVRTADQLLSEIVTMQNARTRGLLQDRFQMNLTSESDADNPESTFWAIHVGRDCGNQGEPGEPLVTQLERVHVLIQEAVLRDVRRLRESVGIPTHEVAVPVVGEGCESIESMLRAIASISVKRADPVARSLAIARERPQTIASLIKYGMSAPEAEIQADRRTFCFDWWNPRGNEASTGEAAWKVAFEGGYCERAYAEGATFYAAVQALKETLESEVKAEADRLAKSIPRSQPADVLCVP